MNISEARGKLWGWQDTLKNRSYPNWQEAALLAGIDAVLEQQGEPVPLDADDGGEGFEERQVEGYKSRSECWMDSENEMLIAFAQRMAPIFNGIGL